MSDILNTSGKPQQSESLMGDLVSKYSSNLPAKKSRKSVSPKKVKNVLVTGTTGSLGYYLLLSLLKEPQTGTIYCLNRSGEAKANFWNRYRERKDQVPISENKLKFFKVSFGDELFGLDGVLYHELSEEVDVIIHNAWKVNFFHDLSKFESQIRGLHTFVSLCLTSPRQPSLYYTSTIGVANGITDKVIPEQVLTDTKPISAGMGYQQSKWVCENMLDVLYRKYDLDLNVLRIGQVTGPITDELGIWNRQEWVPSLIQTSKSMGILPATTGMNREIDWIPVDSLADIIVEIIFAPKPSSLPSNPGVPVFNLVNPTKVRFDTITPMIQSHFGNNTKIVSLNEWVDCLGKLDRSEEGALQKYPALRLLSFFNGITGRMFLGLGFETGRALGASPKMRKLEGISGGMFQYWLRQWKL